MNDNLFVNNTYFFEALKRLWPGQTLTFSNIENSFEFLLRPVLDHEDMMEPATEMRFELLIVYDADKDDDGEFEQLLDREFNNNEDGEHLVDEYVVDKSKTAEESFEITYMMSTMNRYARYRVCPCSKYLIKDNEPLCIYCHMTASEQDMTLETCMICHDESPRVTMEPRPCCKHLMHKRCIKRWCNSEASGDEPTCPTCRAPIKA